METLSLPFRRNLKLAPVIGPVGPEPIAVPVPPMTGAGVTTFILSNPNPFHIWFAGWQGSAGDMPVIKDRGHYMHPGEKYLGRTQMPSFVAAVADAEPGFPILDDNGNWLFAGVRTRFILIYGSGN